MVAKVGKILQNIVDNKGLKTTHIAEDIGISHGNFTKLFNSGRQISADNVLKMIRAIAPDKERELMSMYCSEVTMPHNLKIALEYLSTNRILDVFEQTLIRSEQIKNDELKEFTSLYRLLFKYINSDITAHELYKTTRGINVKYEDSIVMLRFLELYSLYEQKEYHFMMVSVENLESQIDSLLDPYLKESYKARLCEMLQYITLKVLNDPIKARTYTDKILNANIGYNFNASSLYIHGISYLFEDVEKCLKFLEDCKQIYLSNNKRNDLEVVSLTIEFIKVLWNQPVDFFLDVEHKAYHMIKNEQKEQGLSILDELDKKSTPDAFRLFIRGEGTDDQQFYFESMKLFLKRGDRYFATLPKVRLLALGVPEYIIDAVFH